MCRVQRKSDLKKAKKKKNLIFSILGFQTWDLANETLIYCMYNFFFFFFNVMFQTEKDNPNLQYEHWRIAIKQRS